MTKEQNKAVRLWTIFATMAKIGCFTFGGGWSIIAQMEDEFVERRSWMTKEQIVDFMSLAKSFPGIMIINMSVLSGYTMAGVPGAVAAAFGLSFPAIVCIAIVTYFYNTLRSNPYVVKILNGVRCVVVPIILSASWKLKDKSLTTRRAYPFLAASFVICAFTNISKPVLIVAGALLGLLVWKGVRVDENVA